MTRPWEFNTYPHVSWLLGWIYFLSIRKTLPQGPHKIRLTRYFRFQCWTRKPQNGSARSPKSLLGTLFYHHHYYYYLERNILRDPDRDQRYWLGYLPTPWPTLMPWGWDSGFWGPYDLHMQHQAIASQPLASPRTSGSNCSRGRLPERQDPPPALVWGKKGWAASARGFRSLSFPLWARGTHHCVGRRECCRGLFSCSERHNSGLTTASENSRQQNQTAKPHHAWGWAVKRRGKKCTGSWLGYWCSEIIIVESGYWTFTYARWKSDWTFLYGSQGRDEPHWEEA